MRSADHSSRQHHDGPSIRIGATTRSGPINSLARSLPLAVRRKDGCGESEFKNRGHRSIFGRPRPRFANRPIRRAPAIVVRAGSPYFGSAGIVTFGATGAQIRTLHGTVVVLRLGTYGLRRASAGPMKWPHLSIRQVFAEPNRRTNRLFLANMSMSSSEFTSDKHATIDTLAPVSALSDRLPDGGDGRNALPSG